LGHRRCVEQIAHLHLDLESIADAGNKPDDQKRVAAEIEEAVINTYLLQIQNSRPNLREQLFDVRPRWHVMHRRFDLYFIWRRQGAPVHFPVRG